MLTEVWLSTSQLPLICTKLIQMKTKSLADNHVLECKLALITLPFHHAKTTLPA